MQVSETLLLIYKLTSFQPVEKYLKWFPISQFTQPFLFKINKIKALSANSIILSFQATWVRDRLPTPRAVDLHIFIFCFHSNCFHFDMTN